MNHLRLIMATAATNGISGTILNFYEPTPIRPTDLMGQLFFTKLEKDLESTQPLTKKEIAPIQKKINIQFQNLVQFVKDCSTEDYQAIIKEFSGLNCGKIKKKSFVGIQEAAQKTAIKILNKLSLLPESELIHLHEKAIKAQRTGLLSNVFLKAQEWKRQEVIEKEKQEFAQLQKEIGQRPGIGSLCAIHELKIAILAYAKSNKEAYCKELDMIASEVRRQMKIIQNTPGQILIGFAIPFFLAKLDSEEFELVKLSTKESGLLNTDFSAATAIIAQKEQERNNDIKKLTASITALIGLIKANIVISDPKIYSQLENFIQAIPSTLDPKIPLSFDVNFKQKLNEVSQILVQATINVEDFESLERIATHLKGDHASLVSYILGGALILKYKQLIPLSDDKIEIIIKNREVYHCIEELKALFPEFQKHLEYTSNKILDVMKEVTKASTFNRMSDNILLTEMQLILIKDLSLFSRFGYKEIKSPLLMKVISELKGWKDSVERHSSP